MKNAMQEILIKIKIKKIGIRYGIILYLGLMFNSVINNLFFHPLTLLTAGIILLGTFILFERTII